MMDFRKIFNTIPEEFDKWRPRYCPELFADLIEHAKLNPIKFVLEIGPGTGQATEPILKSGCSYLAIELGEPFTQVMKNKFGIYDNFQIVNADFETYDFGRDRFDLVYSAATFQWIDEDIGYPKLQDILKSGGTFAHFGVASGSRVPELDDKIQEIYAEHYHPEIDYRDYMAKLKENSPSHLENLNQEQLFKRFGFVDIERRNYTATREFTTEDYISYKFTHCDHLTLKEPYKSKFIAGIKEIVDNYGGKVTLHDDIVLHLARKP